MALPNSTNYGAPPPPNPMHPSQYSSGFQSQQPQYDSHNGAQNGLPPPQLASYQQQPAQSFGSTGKANANVADVDSYAQQQPYPSAEDGGVPEHGFPDNKQHSHHMHRQPQHRQAANLGNGMTDLQKSLAGMSVSPGAAQQHLPNNSAASGYSDYYKNSNQPATHTTRDVNHGQATPPTQQFQQSNNYADFKTPAQNQQHAFNSNLPQHPSSGLPPPLQNSGLPSTMQQSGFIPQQQQPPYSGSNQVCVR